MDDGELTWTDDAPPAEWDRRLAALGGHPLQSALWGDARRAVDGIEQLRWSAARAGRPVMMARIEVRRLPVYGRAAWIPRGPAVAAGEPARAAHRGLLARLRREGYLLCVDDAYPGDPGAADGGTPVPPPARTAWIDLTVGRERLLEGLDAQWRYGVRSAERAGVTVAQSRDEADVRRFFGLCSEISAHKKFPLSGSEALLLRLCAAPPSNEAEARLFVARHAGTLAAGALVLRCGTSLHYFWGAVDRRFSKQRPGEAVHWGVMDWAAANGLRNYDLEGLDPVNNPGTYQFKMKMGGREVELAGKRAHPLNLAGRIAFRAGRWLGKI